jgi:hypothetical protein
MSHKHLSINQLTNIEANYRLGIKVKECALRMQIGKDKVYNYYKLFKQRLTVDEIYIRYQMSKKNCDRKLTVLSVEKLKYINKRLGNVLYEKTYLNQLIYQLINKKN